MTDIETLRLLIGDRKKVAVNENVGIGDGSNAEFQLDMFPMASGHAAAGSASGTLMITIAGTTGVTSTYTITGSNGRLTFNAGSEPAAAANVLASYEYYAMSSGELTDFLSGHTGQPFIAASNACLSLAADNSKLFMYTMGDKTVDKRRVASELRKLSESLYDRYIALRKDAGFNGSVFTFGDNSGTPYHEYDTAVAVYTTS